jgi:hypothetical protein
VRTRFLSPCFIRCFIYLLLYIYISTDIPVILPPEDELVFTGRHLGQGLQANETELPHESAGGKKTFPSSKLIFFMFYIYI